MQFVSQHNLCSRVGLAVAALMYSAVSCTQHQSALTPFAMCISINVLLLVSLPWLQPLGLTRRFSFTGRPIDIVRNALSTMRNEVYGLFSK